MGTYNLPRSVKGEGRILFIFTGKSMIYTVVGGAFGLIFYFIFGVLLGISILGYISIGICALIGYAIATFKIPAGGNSKLAKNVGGDSIDDIIKRYVFFKKSKKIYTYAIDRQEPDYSSGIDSLSLDNIMGKITGTSKSKESNTKTKEEK